jgi:hypothetical protein
LELEKNVNSFLVQGTLTVNPTKTLTIAGTAAFNGKIITFKIRCFRNNRINWTSNRNSNRCN